MNLLQMMNLYLVGAKCDHVPPFRCLKPMHVRKFDKGGKRLFDMRNYMNIIKDVAKKNGVWKPANAGDSYWNGHTGQALWDGVCGDLLPHLTTKTKRDNGDVSFHKSRDLCLLWRTVYRKLVAAGFKGRKRKT